MRALRLALTVACLIVPAARAQEADERERMFRQRCASCHSTQPGQSRIGPHLAQLAGRRAGSVEGARYSPALRNAGLTWDEATLDRFLQSPCRHPGHDHELQRAERGAAPIHHRLPAAPTP